MAQKIESFKKLNFDFLAIPLLKHRLLEMAEGTIDMSLTLTGNVSDIRFYRVRLNQGPDLAEDGLFHNKSSLWYPKSSLIKKYGRVNRPRQPMFYMANVPFAALKEVRINPGQVFTLTELYPSRELTMQNIGIREFSDAPEFSDYKRDFYQFQIDEFKTEDQQNSYLLFSQLLVDLFTQIVPENQDYKYKSSLAVYEYLMDIEDSGSFDGLIYPSIATDKKFVNYAIRPTSADNALKINKVIVGKLINDNDIILFNESSNILEDGTIIYKSRAGDIWKV